MLSILLVHTIVLTCYMTALMLMVVLWAVEAINEGSGVASRSADSITRLLIKMQPISKKIWRGMLDESINYKRPCFLPVNGSSICVPFDD